MTTTLLFLTGLRRDELALLSPAKFVHVWGKYGLALALYSLVKTFSVKSLWLGWKVFAPYLLFRQVMVVLILQIMHDGVVPALHRLVSPPKPPHSQDNPQGLELARLDKEMELATTYDEWRDASRLHDTILERNRPALPLPSLALDRVHRMQHKTGVYSELVETGNLSELQFRLRSELHRKQWGLGGSQGARGEHPEYRKALNAYLNTVCDALALLAKGQVSEEEEDEAEACRERINFFSETLHSFGRTALLLSGGARLGMLHLGVIKALRDQKLIPRVISGSSAGSIIAVLLGAFRDDELDDKLFDPKQLNLHFFQFVEAEAEIAKEEEEDTTPQQASWLTNLQLLLPPPFPDLLHALGNVLPTYWKTGTLLNVHVLSKAIRDSIGDMTFLEAFHRTGRIVNITVSPAGAGSGGNGFPMLLNYLTAPQVLLWSASVASCAIPGVFAPVELLAKDKLGNLVPYYPEGMKWADGSVEADLPMQRLAELFNVNNFVVSQVNPHARFLAPIHTVQAYSGDRKVMSAVSRVAEQATKGVVDFCRDQCRSSVKHFASMLMGLPDVPVITPVVRGLGKSLVPILTQKYTGSITIMPPLSLKGMATILVNPSAEEFLEDVVRGERVTWPHISKLRLSVAIEFLLDDCRQSCMVKLAALGGAGGVSEPSPRLMRKLAVPTASVLNLRDIASLQSVKPAQSSPQSAPPPPFQRMNSLVSLSNKLKNRVQSFAEDLSVMRDVEAKFNRHLNRQSPSSSFEEDNHDDDLDEGNTF
ncbi:hypothetical protein BASA81_010116 [Batrachochytrium salamandrivorans]|nr:hypothetical protein BASA81_010116 [Batrachochytrium salamandrivorans]